MQGFPGGSGGKESTCSVGDLGSSPRWGRSSGEGNGKPLQYSCLENPMNRGAWRAPKRGPKELDTTEKLTRSLSFLSCYGIGILQLLKFSASCLSPLVT